MVLFLAALQIPAPGRTRPERPLLVGYVFPQNTVFQPGGVDAQSLDRVNYAFANIKDGRMVTGFAHDGENFAYLASLRKARPGFTVLVSVGGWEWSTNFSDMALTKRSRAVFINSVMDFLLRYDLDGLDIDWEYPGLRGAGHPFRPEDKQNFTSLVRTLRKRFDRETRRTHRRLYLSIAAGASLSYLEHTEMNKVQRYVDTVNLMSYDYVVPGEGVTGHHSPLFTDPAEPRHYSTDASVQVFEEAGVPAAKILLGVPFYGHVWGQVPDVDHGLRQPGKSIHSDATYGAITSTMLRQGYVRYWDATAGVPWLYNAGKQIFVSYEDPESLASKCRYVVTRKLGGMMFWDYEGDPDGVLRRTASHTLHSTAAKGNSTK